MTDRAFISFYLKSGTIRVFKRSVKTIGYPTYVRFLIHPTKLQMAMVAYDKKELTSFRVSSRLLNDEKDACLRIHSQRLCGMVARRMGWEPGRSYRIQGRLLPRAKAFVFYLSDASDVTRKE